MARRSYAELLGLQFEAERLVREGVSRAEVSRRLGVHSQTLAQWALQGGWRKKDLDMEDSARATRATVARIRQGHERAARAEHLRARLVAAMREAITLLAEAQNGESDAAYGRIEHIVAALEEPRRLEPPEPSTPAASEAGRSAELWSRPASAEPVIGEEPVIPDPVIPDPAIPDEDDAADDDGGWRPSLPPRER